MRISLLALLVVASIACGVGRGDTLPPQENRITVKGNTRTPYKELIIGAANIWEDDYTLPDGSKRRGMTAALAVSHREDRSKSKMVDVYPSMQFTVGNYKITVLEIRKGDPGFVDLQIDPVQ